MSLRNVRILLAVLIALETALLIFGPQARDHLPAIQSALAAKQRPEWWDDAALGLRYAAWINIGLFSLLLLASRWWTRPFHIPPVSSVSYVTPPQWFVILTFLAAGVGLVLRLPLAGKSLWWDEAWVIMQASHGKWRPDPKHPEDLKFMAHDWKRCAFYYQKPTNHAPMSLVQKASILCWQKLTGATREEFSDLAARIPSLIATCAAVVFVASLLRAWGRPGAGVVAAFLLAIHPWYIRYGVDARAYALVVPLCLFGMVGLTGIIRSRGTNLFALAVWGLCEFLWLWAYPNALLDILVLNIVALVLLLRQSAIAADRWTTCLRLAATHIFAAACLVQVFLPNLMQARRWAGHESDAHVLDWELAKTTLSQVFFGVEFNIPAVAESAGLASFGALPFANQVICLALVVVTLVVGSISLWKASRQGAFLVFSIIFSSLAFAFLTRMAGSYFYPRFVMALLPCLAILAAMAFSSGGAGTGRSWAVALTAVVMSGFAFWSPAGHQIKVLLTRPIAPLHDAASFVQQQAARPDKHPLVACYGLGREVMPVYESRCVPLENLADLEKIVQQANAEHRALFVIQGYPFFNRQLLASGFKLLDDPNVFEEVKAFPGIDPEFYFRIFRLAK